MFAETAPHYEVGAREVVADKARREALGLPWFMDGNLGVVKRAGKVAMYGANSAKTFRVKGTPGNPFQVVEEVKIISKAASVDWHFNYLAGGPAYRDPASGRLLLFYHAEVHRGTMKNFFAVLGLAVQADKDGLVFNDLGPIFTPNIPGEQAGHCVEVCGAPYVIKDGWFYVYGRDEMSEGRPRQSNLSVARARVKDVVANALKEKGATWRKYYLGQFYEPALGGRSTPLEKGNPGTRWMDVSYNTALEKFVMVMAADRGFGSVGLSIAFSADGLCWSKRKPLVGEKGELFYPSIVGFRDDPRQTGGEFFVYYTASKKGGWERWKDAEIVRRKITLGGR